MTYNPTANYKKNSFAELLSLLESKKTGLDTKDAISRAKTWGYNELVKKKKLPWFLKLLTYFKNPMIIILIVAAAISGATGEWKSAGVIFAMVILSIGLNFYQEHKSGKAAEKISKNLALRGTILRNGKEEEINTTLIVPGDILLLSAGDIVPADGIIFEADDFFVNESALTGESFPVEKEPEDKNNNWIFSGTNVISGSAKCLVVKTGAQTEYGQIADKINSAEEPNAFEVGINKFGYLLIKIIIFIVVIIFLINAIEKKDIIDSLIFSIAVAVGVTPELLPMIMSVNMARGSIKMSKKGVIVKRLSAIPDFGSMDILCTDKTGTLTEDKITVVKHLDIFGEENEKVFTLAYFNGFFETGIKSILDKAILDFKKIDVSGLKKIDEIPYDFLRRRSSIIYQEGEKLSLVAKGAPEEIFKICSTCLSQGKIQPLSDDIRQKASELYDNLSRQGFRVLAIAIKEVVEEKKKYTKDEENNLTLSGFIAFYDPPKQSAKETVIFMAEHGVEMKILTGDSSLVAEKVCHDLDIPVKGTVSGEDFDINTMSDEEILKKAKNNNIFARFSPMQKEKIISILKSSGSTVGYLGDGINDAPALKTADVGISVDNAVDVAKETADIILMKKGLKELMEGVLEGRKTFGNTMKYIMMGLSSNFGNMFSMIAASIFLPFLPMLPGQILLNNFLYDTSQLSIPSDNVDEEYLKKPKHWNIKFIKKFMITFGPISSLFDILTFLALYFMFHLTTLADAPMFRAGWFVESLATQVLVIYIIRTRKIPFLESRPSKYLLFSTLAVVFIGWLFTLPYVGNFLGFAPLPGKIILTIFVLTIAYLFMVEGIKQIFYKRIYRTE
jgi:Mg2+-importing ATPase